MRDLTGMNKSELQESHKRLTEEYGILKAQKLNIDMSRGKPCTEQLDISAGLFNCLGPDDFTASDGTDCRNYGCLDGIPEAKQLFSDILGVSTKELIIGGNSSLNMMHDTIARAMLKGLPGGETPWCRLPAVKFLCPSPGYDRHFSICEFFNIEMITIPMKDDGPDMDEAERLAGGDASVKGIWCVPKYSNPQGITYSDEVVERLAGMRTKAPDFRIFWDNAYIVHHLTDTPDRLKDILKACKEAGNPDRALMFCSTSKISFPGGGIAVMAGSEASMNYFRVLLSVQTLGPDKLNQLRHVRYFKTADNLTEHMKRHARIIRPKFEAVLDVLDKRLSGGNVARWNRPKGGYFISLDTLEGCALKTVSMAAEAGVILTKAGATFPYGRDPLDRNIRIAPTFPSQGELIKAAETLCTCLKLACIEKLLAING